MPGFTSSKKESGVIPKELSFSLDKETAELFTETAEKYANSIVNAKEKMSMHQFRRFYAEVKSLERKTRTNESAFKDKYWPQFGMLKAKIKYQRSRKEGKVPVEFYNLFDKAIEQIKGDVKKFYTFCRFLEAILGFAAENLRN